MRLCRTCGLPVNRPGKAWYCEPCRLQAVLDSGTRYGQSESGRAASRRHSMTPKAKIRRAAWDDANLDKRRKYDRERRARKAVPVIVRCASELCTSTFIRGRHQGRKIYCRGCFAAFYGPANARRRRPDVAA